eukprot:jgi/Ulvmu1/7771/UM039_0080.1
MPPGPAGHHCLVPQQQFPQALLTRFNLICSHLAVGRWLTTVLCHISSPPIALLTRISTLIGHLAVGRWLTTVLCHISSPPRPS